MSTSPTEPHSFVVKIWSESDGTPRVTHWRGSITHVESRTRSYFTRLPQLVSLLAPYVRSMDGRLDIATRLISWWMAQHAGGLPPSADRPPMSEPPDSFPLDSP
jgi:hypothetical protein